jgi:hypothetical protein
MILRDVSITVLMALRVLGHPLASGGERLLSEGRYVRSGSNSAVE